MEEPTVENTNTVAENTNTEHVTVVETCIDTISETKNSEEPVVADIVEPIQSVDTVLNEVILTEITKPNSSELILNVLKDASQIDSMLDNLNCNLDNNSRQKIDNILNFLCKNDKVKKSPINQIIVQLQEVFEDGKLDLLEIPILINLVVTLLNTNLSNVNFTVTINDVSVIIKILIQVLIMEKVIKISSPVEELKINRLIDSSVLLLNTTMKLPTIKCSCMSSHK